MWLWLWLFSPRYVQVPIGRVADFCPLCRFVKPFEIVRVELERLGRQLPLLAKALRPLRPTRDELEAALASLRDPDRGLARRLSASRLQRAVDAPAKAALGSGATDRAKAP